MSRPLLFSLLAALLAAMGTGGGLTFFNRARSGERAQLQRENARLREEAHRRVVTQQWVAPVVTAPEPVAVALVAEAVAPAVSRYRDLGQDSPQATLQTLAWAGDRGDAAKMRELILFDPEARAMAEAYFASLPPEVRASFGDLDSMAAALLTRAIMRAPYPEAGILAAAEFEPIESQPNRRRLSLPDTPKDGQIYEQADGVWKYVITAQLVRAYFAENGIGEAAGGR